MWSFLRPFKVMCLLLISYSLLEHNSKIVYPLLIMQIQVECWQPFICFSCSCAEFSSLSTFSHFCRVWTAFCSCSPTVGEDLLLLPLGVQSGDQPQGESVSEVHGECWVLMWGWGIFRQDLSWHCAVLPWGKGVTGKVKLFLLIS